MNNQYHIDPERYAYKIKHKSLLIEKTKHVARQNVLDYTTYTFPEYEVNWHHAVMAGALTRFANGDIKKLMFNCPPQTGKSELSTRRIASYLLGTKPDSRVALGCYNHTLSAKFNRQIQRIMTSQVYHDLFPNVKLSTNSTSKNKTEYVKTATEFEVVSFNGSFLSIGVGGGITGNPVDYMLIDDPIKGALEAHSQTYRDRVWDWYTDDVCSRFHNNSQQLITLTRWHDDDLAGRILAQEDDWYVITLRAIKENDNFDYDPRKVGEVLWPNRHSLERMESIKKLNPKTFYPLYQQQTTPEDGDVFKRKWFSTITESEIPPNITIDIFIDGAYTKNTENDPTGIDLFAYVGNKMIWILSVNKHLEMPELLTYIKSLYKTYKLGGRTAIYIEPKASGKSIKQLLFNEGYNAIELKGKHLEYDKLARAMAAQPTCESGKVQLVKSYWNEAAVSQLVKFPNSKHDEQVDNLSYAIHRYFIQKRY